MNSIANSNVKYQHTPKSLVHTNESNSLWEILIEDNFTPANTTIDAFKLAPALKALWTEL